jgi:hypothetical protein
MLMTSRRYPVETAYVAVAPATPYIEEPRTFWEKAATVATVALVVPFALLLLIGL